jgi:Galactose-3-O-sulfotransferase
VSQTGREILLFLHIPKTAGSTLHPVVHEQYADAGCGNAPELRLLEGLLYDRGEGFFKPPGNPIPAYVATALEDHDVRAVVGHFSFGVHRLARRSATYMTMLRAPADRVTSLYFHLKTWSPEARAPEAWFPGESDRPFTQETTLEEFVTSYALRELDNDQTRRVSGIEPRFGECTRDMLDVAKRNMEEHFDVVGLTERFDESLALASHVFGWTSEIGYWPDVVNEARVPVSQISLAAREAILDRNELDRELYQFAQDRFQDVVEDLGPAFESRLQALRVRTRRRR